MKVSEVFTNKYMVALLAIITCILWGSAFPSVKTGYRLFSIPSDNTWLKIIFAGYRFFLAGVLILAFAKVSKQKMKIKGSDIKHIIILGFISTTVSYFFFYLGLARTTGVKASILNSTLSFFTVIIAHLVFANDKINRNKIMGLLLGFAGVIVANFSFEIFKLDFSVTGDGFLIVSQIAGAVGAVYLKKISDSIPVIMLTGTQMIVGSLFLIIPASLKVGVFPFHFNATNLVLYLYLAFLSAVAFSIWNTIIKYNAVGKIAIYQFLIPVFGVILSAMFLPGEKITPSVLIALVLVSLGILTVNIKTTKADKIPVGEDG